MTHTLTLLVDGRVRVEAQAWSAVVDVKHRVAHPPSVRVPDAVMDAASTLARSAMG